MKRLLLTLLAVLVAAPATGQAAVAGRDSFEGDTLIYAADRGERNRVTVSRDGDRIVFEDPGNAITPGQGCSSLTPNRVSCQQTLFVNLQLEDGDDEATSSGTVTQNGAPDIGLFGEQGNDTLRGSADTNVLNGGAGTDSLLGGTGTTFINAADILWFGDLRFMPRRAPARDEVSCAVPAAGQQPASVDAGEEDAITGSCGQVARYREGDILVRGTEGADDLFNRTGPTLIQALGGNDTIRVDGVSRAEGGPGDDTIIGTGFGLGGSGDDRLDIGGGVTSAGRMDGQSGDDFITGGQGNDRFTGGTGNDRISGRIGNDLIRANDGDRDVVRCGQGRDVAVVDRRDAVARDCERRRMTSSAGAAAVVSRRCRATIRGGQVITRTTEGVVVQGGRLGTFYGCLFSTGRQVKLTNEGGGYDETGPGKPQIAGRYVAYITFGSAIGDEFDRLYVFDLRARRAFLVASSGGNIAAFGLKSNGSVAWVENSVVAPAAGTEPGWEVHKIGVEENEGNVLLDRGAGIDPTSLALSADRNTVLWTNGGQARSAPIR